MLGFGDQLTSLLEGSLAFFRLELTAASKRIQFPLGSTKAVNSVPRQFRVMTGEGTVTVA